MFHKFQLTRNGLRGLRLELRRMGASKRYSGWALADLLAFRPQFVEFNLPSGQLLRVEFI